jgi:Flp pilus assembly protein TadD
VSDTEGRISAAEAAFSSGQHEASHQLALAALADAPDDPRLLRIAGLSSLELGLDDAVVHLGAVARLRPDDPQAWRDLGEAAMEDGDVAEGMRSFRRLIELDPSDESALVNLALTARAQGQPAEALGLLSAAAGADAASPRLLRTHASLAEAAGDHEAALGACARLLALDPKDVGAGLALADLQLATGQLAEAARSFAALRTIDDDDGHASFAYHGQVEALLRGERWRAALDLAIESTRADRLALTTDLLQYATAKLFGEADRSARPWPEIEQALVDERAAHRRMHADQEAL